MNIIVELKLCIPPLIFSNLLLITFVLKMIYLFHHKHFQTYCDYKLYNIYKVLKTIGMSSPFDLRANKQ